jgi:hypothetical protein
MTTRTLVVSRADLPQAVFDLLRVAFPDDPYDQDAFRCGRLPARGFLRARPVSVIRHTIYC